MRDFFLNPFHGLFMAAALLVLSTFAHSQQTIHIPADHPTIQSGIDSAQPGDTLLVSPGTYPENLDFHGKAITLQSAEGPATTILDGRRLAPTVSFTNGEPRATTLTGFTIRNGAPATSTSHGAGILLQSASPTVTGNILTDNLCAAIDATASAPLIQNNQVTRTQVTAACLAQAIAPIILTGPGPAGLTATLIHNTIESNDLTTTLIQPNAGAIALLAAPATLQGNILRLNTVLGTTTAGIQILAAPTAPGGTPTLLEQNLIYNNTTHCGPAALSIAILNSPATTATPHLELQILNNTIADNLTDSTCPDTQPSEVALDPSILPAQILLANNIFSTSTAHTILACSTPLPQQMFHHNLLHNPTAPAFSNTCPDSGANLLQDPQFKDRAQSDYHLKLASPAVDAGSDAVAAMLPAKDLDATPRLQNATEKPTTIIDFGAYEYPAAHDRAPTTTILNTTVSPSEAFQSVTLATQVTTPQSGTQTTTPTGSVTVTASAPGVAPVTLTTMPLDSNGKATYTTSAFTPGAWTLLATYSGAETLAPSTSAPMLQNVSAATTVLAFDITPSTAAIGQAVTAMATITAPLSTQVPTGQIQFFDLVSGKPVLLGTPTLDSKGHTQLTLPALAPGTHRIMAFYAGTASFTAATLPIADALLLTIGAADFTMTPATSSMTIQTLHHAPDTMALASLGTFADTVTLSCTNLPAYASCTFAPSTATLTAGAKATMVLTLDTSVIHNFYARVQSDPAPFTLAATFPLTLLTLLGLRRPLSPKARRKLVLLAAMLPLLIFTGCGAGKYPDHTPPGTYQINVIATAATTGISHTTQLTLVVTE